MSLTAADIQEIMRLIEVSNFDELTLETNGLKLMLRRGAAAGTAPAVVAPVPVPVPVTVAVAAAPTAAPAVAPRPVAAAAALPTDGGQDVPSPMLGTFYRAPKPGAPPFVEVGAEVEADTVIGIIEVMKLMSTVRAGLRGRVTQILASDGVLVEFGEVLLRISPAA